MTKGIYCFTNKINGKKYIGQSIHIEERYKEHLSRSKNLKNKLYGTYFYRALRKYGADNFNFEIIDSNWDYTKDDLNRLERYYIKKYNTFYEGYNCNDGGDSIYIPRKLTPQQVLEIKNLIANTDMSFQEICNKYNLSVDSSLISQINQGKIWSDTGKFDYPIRKDTFIKNKGGNNPNAKLTNEDVIKIREMYVNKTLTEIYPLYESQISFYELKKIVYGSQFKSLPIYKKREKKWYLNGTCIDYPRLEE